MPSLTPVKSNLYRKRRKRLPPTPQSRAEVTLTGDWVNTLGGQPFVLAESGAEDKIILLGTQFNHEKKGTFNEKKRYIQRDEKIRKLFECFQNGESSLAK